MKDQAQTAGPPAKIDKKIQKRSARDELSKAVTANVVFHGISMSFVWFCCAECRQVAWVSCQTSSSTRKQDLARPNLRQRL